MPRKTFIAKNNRICTSWVFSDNGIISAVGKRIIPQEALTSAYITIHIDKSTDSSIIVAGLEVVEAGFIIVVITAITDRVHFRHIAGGAGEFAVGVVFVRGYLIAAFVHHVHHVALQVCDIVINLRCGRTFLINECIRQTCVVITEVKNLLRFRSILCGCCDGFPQEFSACIDVAVFLHPLRQ